MKHLSLLVVGIFLTLSSVAFATDGVQWLSLNEGMEKAKMEKKPVIVDFFFGKGCPRCEKLQSNVYENPSIAKKIMDDFVPVRVDLTKKKLSKEEEALGNKYDFKNDCLLLFLDHEGNIVKDPGGKRLCFVDYVEPDVFIQYLDMVKGKLSN
ncbi:MAG: thioredoxin family protein [Thermodesulfovibrionales bacterium]